MTARTVLIPGGVRGIGRAVAVRCLREGWYVSVCHRRSHEDARTLLEEAGDHRERLLIEARDVCDASDRAAIIGATRARFGEIDALVHAAGPFDRGPLLSDGVSAWRSAYESNVIPLVALSEALVPAMMEAGWGRVIAFAIAGVERLSPPPTVAPYVASKAAVLAFVRALAKQVAHAGVTANAVSPGVIDTGGVDGAVVDTQREKIPMRRVGTPDEAAFAVCSLLAEDAGYITGANIEVAGGWGL